MTKVDRSNFNNHRAIHSRYKVPTEIQSHSHFLVTYRTSSTIKLKIPINRSDRMSPDNRSKGYRYFYRRLRKKSSNANKVIIEVKTLKCHKFQGWNRGETRSWFLFRLLHRIQYNQLRLFCNKKWVYWEWLNKWKTQSLSKRNNYLELRSNF